MMETTDPNLLEDLANAAELRTCLSAGGSQVIVMQIPTYMHRVPKTFWRGLGLYDAVCLMVRHSLGNEALFQARALFEESLVLAELVALTEGARLARLLQLDEEAERRTFETLQLHTDLGLSQQDPRLKAKRTEQAFARQAFAEKKGIEAPERPRSMRSRASALGLQEDFWRYEVCHQMVHGNDLAFALRTGHTQATLMIQNRTLDPKELSETLHFASRSMIRQYEACQALLNWTPIPLVHLSSYFSGAPAQQAHQDPGK